jgi:putative transposase
MGHTYHDCLFHVIFSTKERRAFPIDAMQRLHRYMVGIAEHNDFTAILIGGVEDHVHLLLSIPCSMSSSKAVQLIKGGSSKWFNEQFPGKGFAWQEGFAVFTVSRSQEGAVRQYIANQEEHHRKRDFAAEFLSLLKKHGVEYDPMYVLG